MPTKRKVKTAIGNFLEQLEGADVDFLDDDESEEKTPKKKSKILSETVLKKPPTVDVKKAGKPISFSTPSGTEISLTPKLLDTKDCSSWEGNTRIQELLSDERTQELRDLIKSQGQLIPVLARPKGSKYEIIYGSRRLFVCRSLGIKIKALVGDISDIDAIYTMDAENAGREAPSPYEKGVSYKQWIKSGVFRSQSDLATKLGITRTWVNQVIRLTEIPIDLIKAIKNPSALTLENGHSLLKKYNSFSKTKQKEFIKQAEKLSKTGFDSKEIISSLLKSPTPNRTSPFTETRPIVDMKNREICKIQSSQNGQVKIVFNKKLSQNEINELVKKFEMIVNDI